MKLHLKLMKKILVTGKLLEHTFHLQYVNLKSKCFCLIAIFRFSRQVLTAMMDLFVLHIVRSV